MKLQDNGKASNFLGFRFVAVKLGKGISRKSGLDNQWEPLGLDNPHLPIIISEDTPTSHKGEWGPV